MANFVFSCLFFCCSFSLFAGPLDNFIDYGLDMAIKKSFKADMENVTLSLLKKRNEGHLNNPLLNLKTPLDYALKYKRQKILLYLLEQISLKDLTDQQKTDVFSIIIKNNSEDSFEKFINKPTFLPQEKWFYDHKKTWGQLIAQHEHLNILFEKRMRDYFLFQLTKPLSTLEVTDAVSDSNPLWLYLYLEMFDKSDKSGQTLRDLLLCDLAAMTSSTFEEKSREPIFKRFIESLKRVSSIPTFCGKYHRPLFELLGNDESVMAAVLDHPSIKDRDINLNQDYVGTTIIHYYVGHKRNKLLKALLYHPLYLHHEPLYNPLIKDSLGDTPLHTGVRVSNFGAVELLLLHPNTQKLHLETSPLNHKGKTPWQLAQSQSSIQRAYLLEMIFNKTHLTCSEAFSCFPALCTPIVKKAMAHLWDQDHFSSMQDVEFKDAVEKITPISSPSVSIISYEEAQEIFSFLKTEMILAFHQWDDGCYARAHYISLLLDHKFHLKSAKAFVTGPLAIINKKGRRVEWSYHVAPTLHVVNPDSQQHEMMVFDVILGDRPLTIEEWKRKQSERPLELKVKLTPASVYSLEDFEKFKKLKKEEKKKLNYLPLTTISMFSDLAELLMSR